MPKRRYLNLNPEEKMELEHVRDHHEKPYMREKAAAMLKIEAGMSPHAVALTGLLKPLTNWLPASRPVKTRQRMMNILTRHNSPWTTVNCR